ncbi:MAG TPA: hypothetical protein VKT77_10575 [Chthonomonadaceae bacterium]|nr:hypothetical protein [Chthonomonadaceae bacterium]
MKKSKHFGTLVMLMPIVCVVASAAIVTQQSIRRTDLQRRYAAFERERDMLEKRYRELRKASGVKGDAQDELDAMSARHDDGD